MKRVFIWRSAYLGPRFLLRLFRERSVDVLRRRPDNPYWLCSRLHLVIAADFAFLLLVVIATGGARTICALSLKEKLLGTSP